MNIINKEQETTVSENMKGVIDTSKKIRDTLLSPDVSAKEKTANLEFFKLIISANKSIVTATVTELTCHKLAKEKVSNVD